MTDVSAKSMQDIWDEANAAAQKAMDDLIARVGAYDFGCCGFTSVIIRPARGKFVKWCKDQIKAAVDALPQDASDKDKHIAMQRAEHTYGDIGWNGGWHIYGAGSDSYNGQALDVKEAAAKAFANVLKENGIAAHYTSRMD